MNSFDVFLLVVLLIFATLGAWRGFVREIFSLIAWVIAGMLALLFAGRSAELFPGFVGNPALRLVLAFMTLFILIFLGVTALAWWIDRVWSQQRRLRVFNRIFGAAFGMLRGGALLVAAFLFAGLTNLPQRPWWRDSVMAPVFVQAATYIKGYLPRDVSRHIRYG